MNENVVAASAGNFKRALRCLLAVNVSQIDGILRGLGKHLLSIDSHGLKRLRSVHQIDGLRQRLQSIDVDAFHHCCFSGVGFGDSKRFQAKFACGECCRKRASHRSNTPIQR